MEDNGTKMVECDYCHNWYHESCFSAFDINESWYCSFCKSKVQLEMIISCYSVSVNDSYE
jgi:hypothetical protein